MLRGVRSKGMKLNMVVVALFLPTPSSAVAQEQQCHFPGNTSLRV